MIYEATDQTFDELVQADYAVVDVYGTHCGPCKAMEPVYDALSCDLALIRFLKVNVDLCPELGERFHIKAVPTLLFFRDGRLFFEDGGGKDQEMLNRCISRLLYE